MKKQSRDVKNKRVPIPTPISLSHGGKRKRVSNAIADCQVARFEKEMSAAKAPVVKSARTSPEAAKKTPAAKSPPLPSPTKPRSAEKAVGGTTNSSKDAVKLPSISRSSSPSTPINKGIEKAAPSVPKGAKTPAASPSRADAKNNRAAKSSVTPSVKIEPPLSSLPVPSSREQVEDVLSVIADTPSESPIEQSKNGSATANAESEAQAQTQVQAATAVAMAEAERIRKERGNGMVKLVYEQYDEEFSILDGSTTQANIDEVYCLSFVMPECLVHLSHHPSAERFARENAGVFDSLVREEPRGVYQGLEKDTIYYVVVEQEADQLRRDQEATRAKWDPEIKRQKDIESDGRGFETCSCVYGNPCVDEYGCKDWHARFAVATANGWKGF